MKKKNKDIEALNRRIDDFKIQNSLKEDFAQPTNPEYSKGAIGFQVSIELLAGVLVGAGMGYVLDYVLGTRPWFLALLTVLGGAAGILSIYRSVKTNEEENNHRKD